MLVLSRKLDQSIMIGDGVEITVVDIRGDKVRLGISAPGDVAVHRKEIWVEMQARKERAGENTPSLAKDQPQNDRSTS